MYVASQLSVTEEVNQLRPSESGEWTHSEVREELGRILGSRFFVKSERLSCFLSTAVWYLLEGKGDRFKEYTVGTEVYKRPSSYDPTQDSIVRTEARRLRAKLKEYYSSSPCRSSLMILLSAGSYIPVIQPRRGWDLGLDLASENRPNRMSDSDTLLVGVFPFNTRTADCPAQTLACNIEDELTHELSQQSRIRVFRTPSGTNADPMEYLRLWNRSGVQLVLQGYVNRSSGGTVVQIQLTTISGMIVWSGRFDGEALNGQYGGISATVLGAVLSSTTLDQQGSPLAALFSNTTIQAA